MFDAFQLGVKTAGYDPIVAGLPQLTFDRPKGTLKKTRTLNGRKIELAHPVDYGYFDDYINPDDNEHADVWVGTARADGYHGRFMKGKFDSEGNWKRDEQKWYVNLTYQELEQVIAFYAVRGRKLLRDHKKFKSAQDCVKNMKEYCKTD